MMKPSRMKQAALAVAILMVPGSFIVLGLMGLIQGTKLSARQSG